jgi:hypothetical protein
MDTNIPIDPAQKIASCSPTLAAKTKAPQGWGAQTVLRYIRTGSVKSNKILVFRYVVDFK